MKSQTVRRRAPEWKVSGFTIQRDLGNSTGFRAKDGLLVLWLGTFRVKQEDLSEASGDTEPNGDIFSVFMVKSDRDTRPKLDVLDGIGIRTNSAGGQVLLGGI